MGYIFYWILVISPRKIQKLFFDLGTKGYHTIEADNSDLHYVITQLEPVYPIRPRKDQDITPWKIKNAAMRVDSQATKLIAHVSKLQVDQPGVGHNATQRRTILFIEKRKLDLNDTIHITPKQNPGNNLWEKRYKANKVTDGYEENFLNCYDIYSPGNDPTPLPEDLCNVLIDLCPTVCQRELFCFQGGINLMFCSEGWGFCPANEVYKEPDFTMMLDFFDRISNSIH
jgi:hypothetical protein